MLVGLITDTASVKSGSKVKFRYLLTGPASVKLEIRKGSKVVARLTQSATAAGRRTLNWNGRGTNRKALAAGNYTTRIAITGGGGTDTDTGKLKVRRR